MTETTPFTKQDFIKNGNSSNQFIDTENTSSENGRHFKGEARVEE